MGLKESIKYLPLIIGIACSGGSQEDLRALSCEEINAKLEKNDGKKCVGPNAMASEYCLDTQKIKGDELRAVLTEKKCETN